MLTSDITAFHGVGVWLTGGSDVELVAYAHDALGRPVSRNDDSFAYNARGEVVFSRRGAEDSEEEIYSYDFIGNLLSSSANAETNRYSANSLNQYTSVLRVSVPPREAVPQYDADGNLVSLGPWAYAYDAASRLVSVSSNGVPLVTNFYDAKSRRVKAASVAASSPAVIT